MTFEEFWENSHYKDAFGDSEPYYGIAQYAFEVGQENGVVWHDLRKNPGDLPEHEKWVLDECGNKVYFYNGNWYCQSDLHTFATEEIDVFAWCEIPKFEECRE